MKIKNLEKIKPLSQVILFILLETGGELLVAFLTGSRRATTELSKEIRQYTRPKIRQALERFRRQGLIKSTSTNDNSIVYLTEYGTMRAKQLEIRKIFSAQKTKKWDKLWRVIIFDIPEKRKIRRRFWRELKILGFYRLQQSVYVYPHDCEVIMQKLKDLFELHKNIVILTTASLGPLESNIKKTFFG